MNFPFLTTDEMLALENYAIERYGISVEAMMQNAGKALFNVVQKEILAKQKAPHVLVVTGKGNNGGDALVAARLFHENLIYVEVLSPYSDDEFSEAASVELEKCNNLGIVIETDIEDIDPDSYDLIVDGLFGFSLKGDPRPPADQIIEALNQSKVPIISVDVPSGLDVHTGQLGSTSVKADYILAYGMPKKGLEPSKKLYLGDLGIPSQAYQDKGYVAPDFRGRSYIELN